jgi:hypothetical protein
MGCEESRNDYKELALSPQELAKAVRLQRLFEDRRVRVGTVYVANEGCKVYRSREQHGVIVAWDMIELPRTGYPALLTGCSGMSMEPATREDGYLYFRLCQMAFGAGGGCQRGGHFRTQDGATWECEGQSKEQKGWARCKA